MKKPNWIGIPARDIDRIIDKAIIETCTDMLEEEANDHNDVGEGVEDENAEET